MSEQTLIIIKPDGVRRGLVGAIISRFEQKGYVLKHMNLTTASLAKAHQHYQEHTKRPFFNDLVDFFIGGPIVVMVWEGPDVVAGARKLIGATRPVDYVAGTIRGDYSNQLQQNLIHGSDSVESATREIDLWCEGDY